MYEKVHSPFSSISAIIVDAFDNFRLIPTFLPPLTNFSAVILPSFSPPSLLNIAEIRSKI
jgi:hypothetical protein